MNADKRPSHHPRFPGKAEIATILVRIHAPGDDCGVRTYIAVRSSEALATLANASAEFRDAEMLPWDMLPGIRKLAGDHFKHRDPRMQRQPLMILGTTEGRAWATWHLPVEPPPVPA